MLEKRVVVEEKDLPHPRLRNQIQDIGAGPPYADDGYSLILELPSEIRRVLSSGGRVRKVKDAAGIIGVSNDFPLLGSRLRGDQTSLVAQYIHIGGHLMVVVAVAVVRLGRKLVYGRKGIGERNLSRAFYEQR